MTTFKEIRGTTIEVVSSDPTNPETGQIWYNSSSGTLKGYVYATVNAWSAGGNMNTARASGVGGVGNTASNNAALGFGGYLQTGGNTGASESYNGTSWTNTPSLNTARRNLPSGLGTQTAALCVGGFSTGQTSATESFNGSSWTTVNSLNTAGGRQNSGTQTAGLAFGGYGGSIITATESWNGTSWTTTPANLNTGRFRGAGFGLQTASVLVAGDTGGDIYTSATELYNGTSWTSNPTGYIRATNLLGGAGTQTAGLCFGGGEGANPGAPISNTTVSWNGSTFTTLPATLTTAREGGSSAGSQTSALFAAGTTNVSYQTATEEWTGSQFSTKTVTVS